MQQDHKKQAVAAVLKKLQPAMEVDGGGIEYFTLDEEHTVSVKFKGTCLFCPSQKLTLNMGIKRALINELPWVRDVVSC